MRKVDIPMWEAVARDPEGSTEGSEKDLELELRGSVRDLEAKLRDPRGIWVTSREL